VTDIQYLSTEYTLSNLDIALILRLISSLLLVLAVLSKAVMIMQREWKVKCSIETGAKRLKKCGEKKIHSGGGGAGGKGYRQCWRIVQYTWVRWTPLPFFQ